MINSVIAPSYYLQEEKMMKLPEDHEITLLFEGNEQQLQQFVEHHRSDLERRRALDYAKDVLADRLPIEEKIRIVFGYVYGVNVDWREYDRDIIEMFGERLPESSVGVEETDTGLDVTYNGQHHLIPLQFNEQDRYVTIRGFQEIIKDTYEIRLFEDSYFSDTHQFLLLPKQQWNEVDTRYPDQSKNMFRVIDAELDFP